MSRFVLRALALIAAGWTMSAQAADLNYGSRAPYTVNQPLNAYSWAGPYLGGNLGYAWGSVDNNPTKPSGFVGRRSGRLQLADRSVGVRRRRRHPGDRRRRYLRALEILQPLVRHRARPGRLCAQQHPVLRHRRSGLRRIARPDLRPVGIPHQRRLDRWASAPNSASRRTGAPRSNISMSISPTATSSSPARRTAIASAWCAPA